MNYSGLETCDTLNGIGFRVVMWVSGCGKQPKCPYCQNSKAWDFNSGKQYTEETEAIIIDALSKDYISGLTLTGGEITDNLSDGTILNLLNKVKTSFPDKNIWAWSGYKFEDLINDELKLKFLKQIDVLIDGEFILSLKDLNRAWGNSTNQRIIDVQKSLRSGEVVLLN